MSDGSLPAIESQLHEKGDETNAGDNQHGDGAVKCARAGKEHNESKDAAQKAGGENGPTARLGDFGGQSHYSRQNRLIFASTEYLA